MHISFLKEFEEVCSMLYFHNTFVNVVRMKPIPFTLELKGGCMVWLLILFLLGLTLLSYS